jgi:hypothetical protein
MEPLQISETEWVVLFGVDRYPTREACEQAIRANGRGAIVLETHWHPGPSEEEKEKPRCVNTSAGYLTMPFFSPSKLLVGIERP